MAFTDKQIAALKPEKVEYHVGGTDIDKTLYIRVLPSGTKSFVHIYHHPQTKKQRRDNFGKFGKGGLNAKQARVMHDENKALLAQGIDPKTEKIAANSTSSNESTHIGTMEDLFEIYYKYPKKNGKPKKSVKNIKQSIEKHLFNNPDFKNFNKMPARDVRPEHVMTVLRGVSNPKDKRYAPTLANRLRSYLQSAFNKGRKSDLKLGFGHGNMKFNFDPSLANPVIDIEPNTIDGSKRDRVLTYDEIKGAVNSDYFNEKQKLQIKLLVAYGSRVSEIVQLPISEIDFDNKLWVQADSDTRSIKNDRTNLIPLTDLGLRLFKDAYALSGSKGDYLFPKTNGYAGFDFNKPACRNTLSDGIKGYCEMNNIVPAFTGRDLRRTFKTILEEEGAPSEILNAIQNHGVTDAIAEHYNLATYIKQKTGVLNKWHTLLIEHAGFDGGGVANISLITF